MALVRTIPIQNVVLDAHRLAELLKVIADYYRKAPADKPYAASFEFSVSEDEHTKVITDTPPKDFKTYLDVRLHAVHICVTNRSPGRSIDCRMIHGDHSGWLNKIEIRGDDDDWVNSAYDRIAKVVSKIEPRNRFITAKWALPFLILFAVPVGWLLTRLGLALGLFPSTTESSKQASFLSLLWFSFFLGFGPCMAVLAKVKSLFPIVEIRTGPPHQWVEVRKRRFWYAISSILIIGPSANFLWDLYKKIAL